MLNITYDASGSIVSTFDPTQPSIVYSAYCFSTIFCFWTISSSLSFFDYTYLPINFFTILPLIDPGDIAWILCSTALVMIM